MALIYMTHPENGVHIVYSEDEQKECEKAGWIVHGPTPPGFSVVTVSEPAVTVPRETLTLPKRKPGRPRRDA